MASRKMKKSLGFYNSEMPEGTDVTYIHATRKYRIRRIPGGALLEERPEEVVLRWQRPEQVFAYIARRNLGIKRKQGQS